MIGCSKLANAMLFVAACGWLTPAMAGVALYIPPEQYIVDTNCDVLMVTVVEVSHHKATRANPPIAQVRVEEAFRGDKPGQLVRALWETPFDPEADLSGPPHFGPPVSKQRRKEMTEYAGEPLASPKVGSKWLVLGEVTADKGGPAMDAWNKYPLTEKRRQWALDELNRREQFDEERLKYKDTWPDKTWHWGKEAFADARAVTKETTLRVGEPILLNVATLGRCRVVELMDDGTVKVRPSGYDSRSDQVVSREKLLLYPEEVLVPPIPLDERYTNEDIQQYVSQADFIGIGEISSEMIHGNSDVRNITFTIHRILKGEKRTTYTDDSYYVVVDLHKKLHFFLRRNKPYVLFLDSGKVVPGIAPVVHQRIPDDDVMVEATDAAQATVKAALKDEKQ